MVKSDVATLKNSVVALVSGVHEIKASIERLVVAFLGDAHGANDAMEETNKLDAEHVARDIQETIESIVESEIRYCPLDL